MGKYMRKPKMTSDTSAMEVVSPLGVRTRAKTLALRKLQSHSDTSSSSSYLQLRSRRLQKLFSPPHHQNPNPRKFPNSGSNSEDGARIGENILEFEGRERPSPRKFPDSRSEVDDSGSFRLDSDDRARIGKRNLEFEGRGMSTRESTPCSFIRESTTAETPGSTTREISSSATNQRTQINNSISQEIEEFFASAEKQQQRLFAERYNFDVVNDVPLPGCYDWVRVEN